MFYDGVREAFDPYENAMFTALEGISAQYKQLVDAGQAESAAALLTGFSMAQQDKAFDASQQALKNMDKATIENSAWSK